MTWFLINLMDFHEFSHLMITNLSTFLGLYCLFTAVFSYLEPLAVALDKEKWSMCIYSKWNRVWWRLLSSIWLLLSSFSLAWLVLFMFLLMSRTVMNQALIKKATLRQVQVNYQRYLSRLLCFSMFVLWWVWSLVFILIIIDR